MNKIWQHIIIISMIASRPEVQYDLAQIKIERTTNEKPINNREIQSHIMHLFTLKNRIIRACRNTF